MRWRSEVAVSKGIVFFFVSLMLLSLSLALVPQVSSQPENINVLSYSWYIDANGYLTVVGEVQNVGPNTIESVVLSGTVYTTDGAAQAYSYPTSVYMQYLIPQQKAPFYIEFPPETSITGDFSWLSLGLDRVDFTVNLANATSNYQYPDLTVASSSGGVDEEGVFWVSGTVKNTGTQTANNIYVIGTFYNASGTVVAVGYTDTLTPNALAPSSTTSFKIGAFDLNQTETPSNLKISSYSLLIYVEGPILSGTAPSLPPSTPIPSESTPPASATDSPPIESPGSENPNVLAPEAIYAIVVIIILAVAFSLLMLRKRKHQANSRVIKNRKSKTRKN
jgi:hypothetical protein